MKQKFINIFLHLNISCSTLLNSYWQTLIRKSTTGNAFAKFVKTKIWYLHAILTCITAQDNIFVVYYWMIWIDEF